MEKRHILVSGKVQGVGFRFFSKKEAEKRRLKGWVRNLTDGRVEILVQGNSETLADFERVLRQGPPVAQVEEVKSQVIEAHRQEAEMASFCIDADGREPWC